MLLASYFLLTLFVNVSLRSLNGGRGPKALLLFPALPVEEEGGVLLAYLGAKTVAGCLEGAREGGRRREEGGRRKEEGGRRREEGGRRKEEGGRRKACLYSRVRGRRETARDADWICIGCRMQAEMRVWEEGGWMDGWMDGWARGRIDAGPSKRVRLGCWR